MGAGHVYSDLAFLNEARVFDALWRNAGGLPWGGESRISHAIKLAQIA
jgi:hypothetical protein